MRCCYLFFIISLVFSTVAAQRPVSTRTEGNVALINQVWYKNGERYVHPSFAYAATGFLINTGKDTLAVTAKHVLWIAKTSDMKAVDFAGQLDRWIMHPKGNPLDSVVIDSLLNTDPDEMLSGPNSSITERDWLIFSTRYVDPDLSPLKIRTKPLRSGEKIWFSGCPYQDESCFSETGTVLETEGNRIVFTKPEGLHVGGASGSPIIDNRGLLVGILGGVATSKMTGKDALYGTSVDYLLKAIRKEQALNVPLIPAGTFLAHKIERRGVDYAIKKFHRLKRNRKRALAYSFSPEAINQLGTQYREEGKLKFAEQIYQLSLQELPLSNTYLELAKVFQLAQDNVDARKACEQALELWPENEAAKELLSTLEH